MAATVHNPSGLGGEVATVRCPACQHVGNSLRTMELISNTTSAVMGTMGVLSIICCQCQYLLAPTYFFLEHFCSNCGIRLALAPWSDDTLVQIDQNMLVSVDMGIKTEAKQQQLAALSPVGPPPPMPVDEAWLRGFASRYASTQPTAAYEIQHGDMSFPTVVYDGQQQTKIFEITRPGMRYGDGRNPVTMLEYASHEHMTATPDANLAPSLRKAGFWDPSRSTPHIQVSTASPSRTIMTTVQLFTNNADFVIHTPIPHSDTYASHRSSTGSKPTTRPAFYLWSSSRGPLLWLVRSVQTATSRREAKQLVLVDAYDRLVAVLGKSLGGEMRDAEGGRVTMGRLEMFAADDGVVVGEILASYAALRYIVWSRERLGLSGGGLGESIGDVFSSGLDLAGSII